MKKLLLTLALVAAFGVANATEVTFDFTTNNYGMTPVDSNTKDDKNTEVNEEYPNNGQTFTYEGVSLTLDKLEGSGSRYWKASSNTFRANKGSGFTVSVAGTITSIVIEGAQNCKDFATTAGTVAEDNTGTSWSWTGSEASVQIVNKGTKTAQIKKLIVTFEGGVQDTRKDAGLSFAETSFTIALGQTFTAPELTKATTADVEYSSSNENVATVDENTGAVKILGKGTTVIKAEAAANDEYKAGSASYTINVIEVSRFVKASSVVSGTKYAIYAENVVAKPLTSNYGYLYTSEALADGSAINIEAANTFTFTADGEGYTIQDGEGYYYYMTGTYNSFNRAQEKPAEGAVWNVTLAADGTATIVNAANSKTFAYSIEHKSFGAYPELGEGHVLPALYVEDSTLNIDAIATETEAPVEYYNLQGVRVANPESGLYIRRQGNKATKVLVK